MDSRPDATPLRVAYFFTRFPHATETFLQREVRAMRQLGVELELYSWHGGAATFEGLPVHRFSKWSLLTLFWRGPIECWRRPAATLALVRALFLTWPRDWLNHWENLFGAGIAAVVAPRFRRAPVAHIHAVWASLPAMAAWGVHQFTGIPFSIGAHAYDIYEHGGDWFLREKCAAARFVHTSTAAARRRLIALGIDPAKIVLVRRGLEKLPPVRAPRRFRTPLRIVCIARLVEKKGLRAQLRVYRSCRDAGLAFTVRIIGDGPLRPVLQTEINALGLREHVTLVGAVPESTVWTELREGDVLVHTGVVAASGDRDGLPNVVPEAMAAGAIVVTAPSPGVLEAITPETSGVVCDLAAPKAWVAAFARIQGDDAWVERLSAGARRWVETRFNATKNAATLLDHMRASSSEFHPGPSTQVPVS